MPNFWEHKKTFQSQVFISDDPIFPPSSPPSYPNPFPLHSFFLFFLIFSLRFLSFFLYFLLPSPFFLFPPLKVLESQWKLCGAPAGPLGREAPWGARPKARAFCAFRGIRYWFTPLTIHWPIPTKISSRIRNSFFSEIKSLIFAINFNNFKIHLPRNCLPQKLFIDIKGYTFWAAAPIGDEVL